MGTARVLIAVVGAVLPFGIRLLGGPDWVGQYTAGGVTSILFISAMNAPTWLTLLRLTYVYRRPISLAAPCLMTFGFLARFHSSLDLSADAQAAIGVVFVPIAAIPFACVGAFAGYLVDRIAVSSVGTAAGWKPRGVGLF
jgi:hypothetical protein